MKNHTQDKNTPSLQKNSQRMINHLLLKPQHMITRD